MLSNMLVDRVEGAFQDPAEDGRSPDPQAYLDVVRANWRLAEEGLRRVTLSLFLVGALFELVSTAGVAQFDFGPIRVTDLTVIRKAIPVVFAYLTLEWVGLGILVNRLGGVHDAVVQWAWPRLYEHDLELPLAPTVMSLASESRIIGEPGRSHTIMSVMTVAKTVAFVILLVAAQVYFQIREVSSFGFADLGMWTAMVLCAFLTTQTFLVITRFRNDPTWTI